MTHDFSLTKRALLAGVPAAALAIATAPPAWTATSLPQMTVTRDPNCGCCAGWTAHVQAAGFQVEVVEIADLTPLKAGLGVPETLVACHTAQVGGYVIEGHVPADAIMRLLAERPQATGLAVPGMPVGSPGMEVPSATRETYDVILFGPTGRRAFARYRGSQRI